MATQVEIVHSYSFSFFIASFLTISFLAEGDDCTLMLGTAAIVESAWMVTPSSHSEEVGV
jgi:hypothetical protein